MKEIRKGKETLKRNKGRKFKKAFAEDRKQYIFVI